MEELAKVCRQFRDAIIFSIVYVDEDETHIYEKSIFLKKLEAASVECYLCYNLN